MAESHQVGDLIQHFRMPRGAALYDAVNRAEGKGEAASLHLIGAQQLRDDAADDALVEDEEQRSGRCVCEYLV